MLSPMAALGAFALEKRQNPGVDVEYIVASLHTMETANITIMTIAFIAVCLRMFVRLKMLRQLGREDYTMVATTAFYIVHTGFVFSITATGKKFIGGDLTLWDRFFRYISIGNGFFALTMIALKWSLGLFFLRIVGHKRPQRYTIYFCLALTSVIGLVYFGIATFTCAQIKDVGILSGRTCQYQRVGTIVYCAFSLINILSDFIMTFIALFALVKAQLPLHTKVIAANLLALGCVGGIASIVRLAIVLQPVDFVAFASQLFNAGLWLAIELGVCIIAANMALTRPLLQLCLEKLHIVHSSKAGTAPPSVNGPTFGRANLPMHVSHIKSYKDPLDQGSDVLLDEIRMDTTIMITDEEKGLDNLHVLKATHPRYLP